MSSRCSQIASRIREVFLDGTWVANTNYQDQLKVLSLSQATHKVNNLNTIGLLTFHVNYYLHGLIHAFDTGKLEISDKYSFDMPSLQTESDWENLVNAILKNAENFASKIENLSDTTLDQPFIDPKYGTYLRNIEAVIEHSYYHLGQISLIRKMIVGGCN